VVTALIQADSIAFQAASLPLAFSKPFRPTACGGLLQSPAPTHGGVYLTTAPTLSNGASPISTTGSPLAASGIRCLNLSEAVALCSNCIVISIQLPFSILLKSFSNSFDLRPLSSRNFLENISPVNSRQRNWNTTIWTLILVYFCFAVFTIIHNIDLRLLYYKVFLFRPIIFEMKEYLISCVIILDKFFLKRLKTKST
jgi:hypothetical protein